MDSEKPVSRLCLLPSLNHHRFCSAKMHSAPNLRHAWDVSQPRFFQEAFGVYQSAWDVIDTENVLAKVKKVLERIQASRSAPLLGDCFTVSSPSADLYSFSADGLTSCLTKKIAAIKRTPLSSHHPIHQPACICAQSSALTPVLWTSLSISLSLLPVLSSHQLKNIPPVVLPSCIIDFSLLDDFH